MALQVGELAPDFTAKNHKGEEVTLSSFRGKKNVTLVFFPFAFTGICTGELCALRDNLGSFENDNCELLAISCDTIPTLGVFAEKEGYKFSILSDFWPHGEIAQKYGTFDEGRGCAIRGTFIIDKNGILQWQVINAIGDKRNEGDYKEVLARLS